MCYYTPSFQVLPLPSRLPRKNMKIRQKARVCILQIHDPSQLNLVVRLCYAMMQARLSHYNHRLCKENLEATNWVDQITKEWTQVMVKEYIKATVSLYLCFQVREYLILGGGIEKFLSRVTNVDI
ncbi:hypothetical protein CR513_01866, partial [Mucuna pruriens]